MSEQQQNDQQADGASDAPTVTRAEAERRVRAQGLRCRGPLKAQLSPREWQRLPQSVQDALAALPAPAEGAPKRTVRQLVNELLRADKLPEARALDEASRVPCGADFGEGVVLKNPLDGRRYSYKCPKCGLEGVYDAPAFNVVEPSAG